MQIGMHRCSMKQLARNLTMVGGYDVDYSYSHDEDSESDDSGDDHPSKLPRHATDPVPPKPPPEPPPEPTSTPPRTVTHPRHIPLTPDISRRLFADLWPSSSTLLPPSIADSTMAPQPKSVSEAVVEGSRTAARSGQANTHTGQDRDVTRACQSELHGGCAQSCRHPGPARAPVPLG